MTHTQKTWQEQRWETLCSDIYEGSLSGNAEHARECRATPLKADAILKLVWSNIDYFGDGYYRPLTEPIALRVEEYFESVAGQVDDQ